MTTWTCWRDASHEVGTHRLFGWPQCTVCGAAPQYHERPAYLPDELTLDIYVPASQKATAIIAERSGIVGVPADDQGVWTFVSYEGWVNGPMQYADRDARGLWEAGVEHAASRLVTQYPTIAQAHLPSETLKRIGVYHPKAHQIVVYDEEALNAWLNP